MKAIMRHMWAAGLVGCIVMTGCGSPEPADFSAAAARKPLSEKQKAALVAAEKDAAFAGADLGFWMSGKKAADLISSVNAIPDGSRTINAVVTAAPKKLVDQADYYVELEDLPANRATGSIRDIKAEWSAKGLAFTANLAVQVDTKIHAHYTPVVNAGAHMGATMTATTRIDGTIGFAPGPDGKSLFTVNMLTTPTQVNLAAKTSIKDSKQVCWSFDYPCGGTWRDPIRRCTAQDCKIAWQYDVPIGLAISVPVSAVNQQLPVQLNIPETIRLVNTKGVAIDKTLKLKVKPTGFDTDERGLALRVGVVLEEVAPAAPAR